MIWFTPTTGDKRIKRRFLIFPKCIDEVCRWLEVASFEQTYTRIQNSKHCHWVDTAWIEEMEMKNGN